VVLALGRLDVPDRQAGVVFGDATHACAAARVRRGVGFALVGLGTYSRELAREVRAAGQKYGVEAFVSDDYLDVEARIAAAAPELVLGTQMERHTAKRLGVPCAVISTPIHVQDVPPGTRRRWAGRAPTSCSTLGAPAA
jgi:light-independent protochlorophyllide reductase subunit B